MKSETVTLNVFGGMTNDGNNTAVAACQLCKGFDIQTRPNRLTPRRSSVNAYSGQDAVRLVNFAYGTTALYGLGTLNGSTSAAVLLSTPAIDVPSWSNLGSGTDSSGTPANSFFIYYHDQLFGASAGTRLWQYDIASSTPSWTWQSLSYTNIAQGIVHSQDDILYIPYDNKIASYDGSSFNPTALTLPSSFVIKSISEDGNYLSIACAPVSGYGNSRTFLWDRDSSLETVSESIDWGDGSVEAIGEVQGTLVGISIIGTSTSIFPRVVFKEYTSTGAVTFLELPCISATIYGTQKVNDGLYFLMDITLPDDNRHTGIWSITGNSKGFSVVHEYLPNNDTALDPSTGQLHGFIIIGGYAYIAYQTASVFYLTKTDDQANYNATSIRQTTINPGMPIADRSAYKQLEAVSLSYVPLPSGAQATLLYRVDGGEWISVIVETTDGAVNTETTADATGTAFVKGRNYEFYMESNGGAEICEVKYRYVTLKTNV
jgi:hypothetical protein